MAAIVLKRPLAVWAALILAVPLPLKADRAADVRAQLAYVASALASQNPTDALTVFDKTMPAYDRLLDYFSALTNSYEIVSEIEVVDEDDTEAESTVKTNWTLQVSDRATETNVRHTYNAAIRFRLVKGKWKIVSFAPVQMFDPQVAAARK